MTTDMPPTQQRAKRVRLSMGWLFVLIASVLLHLIVISWARGFIHLPSTSAPDDILVIDATLEVPIIPKPVIVAVVKPKPKPRPRPVAPPPAEIAAPAADIATASNDPHTTDTSNTETSTTDTASAASNTPDEKTNAVSYTIDLPPSAELKYDIQKTPKEGAPMYGSGTISWHNNGGTYTVDGDFGILFITALRFKSTGTIEDIGIVPELYSEKRFRKSETNTHFHRERNTISFSASTLSYPRTGGEQDRASIIWQLAGIGRGDPAKFVPGASIDLFVAGTRNAETWHILVVGQEEIQVDGVSTNTWHVVRSPKNGSYDQKLDIWLAPQQQWYPIRLRYTEATGDYLDMTLSKLNVSSVP
ncbi:MAG: DUF3108 domain-containing protein [Pseudomonadota bacterium]